MTLYEFNLLEDNAKKADVVWEQGVYIASRRSPHNVHVKIMLYQLPKFYVEVFFDIQQNKILRLLSFSSVGNLDPYLSCINIDDICL